MLIRTNANRNSGNSGKIEPYGRFRVKTVLVLPFPSTSSVAVRE